MGGDRAQHAVALQDHEHVARVGVQHAEEAAVRHVQKVGELLVHDLPPEGAVI